MGGNGPTTTKTRWRDQTGVGARLVQKGSMGSQINLWGQHQKHQPKKKTAFEEDKNGRNTSQAEKGTAAKNLKRILTLAQKRRRERAGGKSKKQDATHRHTRETTSVGKKPQNADSEHVPPGDPIGRGIPDARKDKTGARLRSLQEET